MGRLAKEEMYNYKTLLRVIGGPSLALLGLNGALGSAILFDVAGVTASAGPAGIISFLIGALLFSVLALNLLELSRTFPEAGGPTRYSLYTHGQITNLISSLANLNWYIFIPPFEAFAIIEGLNSYFPYLISTSGFPTYLGAFLGVVITLLFIPLNYFGSRTVARSNFVSGVFKVVTYSILGVSLLFVIRSNYNLTSYGGFFPFGWAGIFASLPLVMFTYAGARLIADYSEEVKSTKDLRIAFLWLVLGQLLFYLLFEYVFVTGLNWAKLGITPGNWAALSTVTSNPFILLATNTHIDFLIVLAIILGIILPFLTGYVYLGGGARILLATSRSGYVSKYLSTIDNKYKTPNYAVITFAAIGGILAFLTAPVHSIFNVISFALVGGYIAYAINAVSMAAARRQGLTQNKIPFGNIIAPATFGIASLTVYWSGWFGDSYSIAIISVGVILFSIIFKVRQHFKNAIWAIFYIGFLLGITYIGSEGALSILSFNLGSIIVLIGSLIVFYPAGVLSALKSDDARTMVKNFRLPDSDRSEVK